MYRYLLPTLTFVLFTSKIINTSSLPLPCYQIVDGGTGYDAKVMYYYDISTETCQKFWYGGDGGTQNRFETEAECYSTCAAGRGIDDNGEGVIQAFKDKLEKCFKQLVDYMKQYFN